MKNKTLLIMAAGMGSRFGGLKQLEPLGPNGEFIIDYSIYDAKQAGFNKVVFIIKEENYEIFKETIGSRVEPHMEVHYVFQKNDIVPEEYIEKLKEREKPLGTGHAIYCAKDVINEPFLVINADDYYGQDAFKRASDIIDGIVNEKPYPFAMIDYMVANTMTENGAVKRGVCEIIDNKLSKITECSIEKVDDKIIATSLNEGNSFEIDKTQSVSMNMIVLTQSIFPFLEEKLNNFLEKNKDDLSKCEFFIPDVLFASIKEEYATVTMSKTTSSWYGITYKEDTENVKKALKEMHDKGDYPKTLWN